MNEADKPFACTEKDCVMTFTNEDHLNWHQKKHDIILNLGVTKNDIVDQTPTPTTFIRNCEEVGLFQDLQNVNPFDEYFKKAVELAKNGGTLEVPETNSDDTLHTPHILPHVEENRKTNNVNSNQVDNNSRSNDFSLNSVIPIESVSASESSVKPCDSTSILIIDDDSNSGKDVKKKIKEALQSKGKQRIEKEKRTEDVNRHSVSVKQVRQSSVPKEDQSKNVNLGEVSETREKIREMNRAAQIRCRKRKQIRWKEMEEEIIILKHDNKRLRLENYNLKCQLLQAKKDLDNSKMSVPVLPQIIPELNSISSPVVIQIVPSTSNPENSSPVKNGNSNAPKTESGSSNGPSPKKFKKNLRKIIPKIIIEN